jgi:hypothetical protein
MIERMVRPTTDTTRKTVVLWTLLLVVTQAAWYLAEPAKSRGPWTWWPLLSVITLLAALPLLSGWASRLPMSPVVEEALRRLADNRASCGACGSPRRPEELFCARCHPGAARAVIGLVAVTLALTVAGVWWLALS